MSDIAVIDYGMGNLRSVSQALEHVAGGKTVTVSSDPAVIAAAERVVFPGQGAMPDCVRELDSRELRAAVVDAAASKPFLGICIGQQLLFEHSEEGNVDGLGILAGRVRRFPSGMSDADGAKLKVPHMGWNQVMQAMDHPLWAGIDRDARFYFVHSYYVDPADPTLVGAWTEYPFRFASAVARNNIFAVQFHPEKSQQAGLALLSNFVNWDGRP
ncbi:MAG TPA: imidazole glycerol phosphate synthase subunit HisH [Novimethylophilus sp.]|jgi:glutamine amidotransferase|uniref:imidazole glycerol phosphate synthase subunit HisH n=1 Tax=Novimethylophilus sp. TaxID=2137426 RepID=UPI002F40731C